MKIAPFLLVICAASSLLFGQAFESGSSGSDGLLNLTSPGVVLFDPHNFSAPRDHARGGVFHFRSIYVGPGVTVRFSARLHPLPVIWLSQGPVQIDGVLDLSGEDTTPYVTDKERRPSDAGSGGYAGGVGVWNDLGSQTGYGLSGGAPNHGGGFTGNMFLVPLFGGSGGGGTPLASGGGGGGALLIASSTSITVTGSIVANGGNPRALDIPVSGGGGGAIRLVAPVVNGRGGRMTARGGLGGGSDYTGADGRIRIEAFRQDLETDFDGSPVSYGKPFGLFLPPNNLASIRVTHINGVPVDAASEGGVVRLPQVRATKSQTLTLQAQFIPLGTRIRLHCFMDGVPDEVFLSTPLEGTENDSRATASVTLPAGAQVYVEANWERSDHK